MSFFKGMSFSNDSYSFNPNNNVGIFVNIAQALLIPYVVYAVYAVNKSYNA